MTSIIAKEAPTSKWATLDVYEGLNYGIYDEKWYGQDMKCAISKEKFEKIFKLTEEKLEAIEGTKKKSAIHIVTPKGDITKEAVLNILYTILTSYEYPENLGFEGKDAITYMKEIKVIHGEVEEMEGALNEEELSTLSKKALELNREYSKIIIDDRNKNMTDKIEQYLNGKDNKTYFVIAGCAHYIGDKGIINELKDKGYEVVQIK